jgi:hypothetical protein
MILQVAFRQIVFNELHLLDPIAIFCAEGILGVAQFHSVGKQ